MNTASYMYFEDGKYCALQTYPITRDAEMVFGFSEWSLCITEVG